MWGESKLAKMACSGSLAPRFVIDDYATAEITYSTAHACQEVYVTAESICNTVRVRHEVLTWSQVLSAVHLYKLHQESLAAAAALGLHWSDTMIMFYEVMIWLHYGYFMVLLLLLLRLLCQPGERLCYGCLASQKRINIPADPMAPQIF